jgi:hypothetical protein
MSICGVSLTIAEEPFIIINCYKYENESRNVYDGQIY